MASDLWSCPSFTELRRDGLAAARWNLLHPTEKPRLSHVEQCLAGTKGPVVASTDYVRAFADQIREFVPRRYKVLGTDGFGRSDSRENLRRFFEVDRHYVAVAALKALAEDGEIAAREGGRGHQEVRHRRREAGALVGLTPPARRHRTTTSRRKRLAAIEVKVPDIGDFKDVPVIELLVKPGDTVKKEDSLVTLESDKATMEVPAPAAGVVKELKVKVGDKVSEGSLVLVMEAADAPAAKPAAGARGRPRGAGATAPARRRPRPRRPQRCGRAPRSAPSRAADPAGAPSHASPGVRRFARELGVDLAKVDGHGPQGPHPQGGRPGIREGGALGRRRRRRARGRRRASPTWACPPGPRWTSRSSARSRRSRSRASRRSRARRSRATG